MPDRGAETMLIVGGSRGIGLAAAGRYAPPRVGRLLCVSRTRSPFGEWVEADLAEPTAAAGLVARHLGDAPLDALLYLGGTWEDGAFTPAYDFAACDPAEIGRVIAVNLTAPVTLVRALLPNLGRAAAPRCVLMGALSGLENTASREVANSASKYGLRGAAHAMRRELPGLRVTVVNPGNVATPEVEEDVAEGRFGPQVPIPVDDLLAAVDLALALSPASVATEINLAQTRGG